MREIISEKLAAIIRDGLMKDGETAIQGLGVFRKKHVPSKETTDESGEVWLMPPKDVIEFESGEK